ncbi:MAG: sigma-54-dependent transcriptional regulator [Thermodesulfobacteriota bacterium]
MQKVLLIDDEIGIRESLSVMLQIEGYDVTALPDAVSGLQTLETGDIFEYIISDIKMPQMNGIQFLKEIKKRDIDSIVIMITAYGNIETPVEAIQNGADDYIRKPVKSDELILRMKMATEKNKLRKDNRSLRMELGKGEGYESIISVSKSMQDLKSIALKASQYNTTVLITGESGTGKELIAKSIHLNSKRSEGPFVAVNCAAIPETLLESELFGYIKGAFSGANETKRGLIEDADEGTLFLDEIGEFPVQLQTKLLRVLQEQEIRRLGETKERKVDVRVIAATNKNLEEEVKDGNFRSDLFYRLNVLPLYIQPLRTRKEDIPHLVEHFIKHFNNKLDHNVKGFSKNSMSMIMDYPWYGNVRELENVIERSMIMSDSETIDDIDLPDVQGRKDIAIESWLEEISLDEAKDKIEKAYIENALEKTNGNRTKAAELLGISRRNLLYKLKEYYINNS